MKDVDKLSELFRVAKRFWRSINIERDFRDEASLDGYVLTVTARSSLRRIIESIFEPTSTRAWTLTGPYGSGKSAFSLFAAKVLSDSDNPSTQKARNILKTEDAHLWEDLNQLYEDGILKKRGLCPILISGSRESIAKELLRGLYYGLMDFWTNSKKPSLVYEVENLFREAERGAIPSAQRVVDLFEQASVKIASSSTISSGLFIIIDELGKFLEYAAQYPDRGDLFILQNLAEVASRSGNRPILLLTILHQAFERYAQRLTTVQRIEWAKVQGRFEDIAFQEPSEQILSLIGRAIERSQDLELLQSYGQKLARQAQELNLIPAGISQSEAVEIFKRCLPLHPTVALIMGPVFKLLAQNERSLFAFLTSKEPYGLQDFLDNHRYSEKYLPLLTLDKFYDYLSTALGSSLYAHGNGKKWAQIELALDRMYNASKDEIRLIKAIGLLGITGEINNLKASDGVLRFAFADGVNPDVGTLEIDRAIELLKKHSVIVFRRYNGSYSLWEGSDIDIEARIAEAISRLDPNERLVTQLDLYLPSRPIVPRRHYFNTGTLRYFKVRYTDLKGFDKDLTTPLDDADGLILYALPMNDTESKALCEKGKLLSCKNVIIAIPRTLGILREMVYELACLRWVQLHTPELEGDAIARAELQARILEVEHIVKEHIRSIFGTSLPSYDEYECTWYHEGQQIDIPSQRDLNDRISKICDEFFYATPKLRNELINRRHLSSSAVSARRNLIKAMLQDGDKERLGIKGFPPEISVYYSLLQETGLHRREKGRWVFSPPYENDKEMNATWKIIEEFLIESESERRSVADLFNILQCPPVGLKSGPLPIILCVALLYYDREIALYEQGSFIPELSIEVFERLMKTPENFEIQLYRIRGVRTAIFKRFLDVLIHQQNARTDNPSLLSVVKPLYRFVSQIPIYSKSTQHLSKPAKKVRDALFQAREPAKLLFNDLPEACGFPAFPADEDRDVSEVEEFFGVLRAALSELQRAYDNLLEFIQNSLFCAFSVSTKGEQGRRELQERSKPIIDFTVEPRLKSFLLRICDEGLDLRGWFESIGTYVVTKPPATWNDMDRARFEINLSEFARSFRHIEVLSFELGKYNTKANAASFRIGVTTPRNPEQERVVFLQEPGLLKAQRVEEDIEQILEPCSSENGLEFSLAVLARLSQKLMQRLEEQDIKINSLNKQEEK